MDTGKNRGADDILAIMGVPNAKTVAGALKFISAFSRGQSTTQGGLTNQKIKDMYLNDIDPDLIQDAVRAAKRVYNVISYPQGHVAALYYIATSNGDGDKVEAFVDELCRGGNGTSKRRPTRYLVENLVRMRMDRTIKLTSQVYSVMLTRAWHKYKRGHLSVKADMVVGLDDKIMEI